MKSPLRASVVAMAAAAVVALLLAIWRFGVWEQKIDPSRFPKTPTVIPWRQAVEVIKSGRAWSVSQSHSLQVGIQTKGYDYFVTTEPRIDAARVIIEEYDPALLERYGTE